MNRLITFLTGVLCGTALGILPLGVSGSFDGDGMLCADSDCEARLACEDGVDVIPLPRCMS